MKKIYLIGLLVLITACNDGFMDKYPQTDITSESFFNTPEDLRTYVNGLYAENSLYVRNNYDNEAFSDNMAYRGTTSNEYAMLKGAYSKETASGWDKDDWKALRAVNFFLSQSVKAVGEQSEIDHYIGTGRYFRAVFYMDKLQNYSNVPWYNKPLETDDPDLYKPSDPRTLVADSIIADLEFAAAHIKPDLGNRTAISRYAAQFLLARFYLQEGTTRKYRAELNLSNTANALLEKAEATSESLINSNVFGITGEGVDGYSALFTSADLSGNDEIILMGEYTLGSGEGNSTFYGLYGESGLSRTLMESYLMKDGSRFTGQPGYDKKGYKDVFADRDPRFMATFAYPGFSKPNSASPYTIHIKVGGYESIKFYPRTAETLGQETWRSSYNDLPVYRYAEVLLIYAESKAELGTLGQADLDRSVNKLRARVNMPSVNLSVANSEPDPVLAAQYPDVSGANKGIILEIRRERRVELALEGNRLQDLHRWNAGERLAVPPQGMYIPALGAYDTTGDDIPDYAFLAAKDAVGPISDLPADRQENLMIYYLDENAQEFYLSEGDKGFIMFTSDKDNPRTWISPKYYYRPVPIHAQLLNPSLEQVFGW
ncbi:MAG: RagB/SusD family nutrient uptake outer membrane protein [Tannerella sp.]|nr:RagB/SusD family nutrient uptake outer membrane protein [Tannerella sp.]